MVDNFLNATFQVSDDPGAGASVPYTGTLYVARAGSATTSDLYTIDVNTGVLTSIGPLGFALGGMAYDYAADIMYGITSNNSAAHPRSLISIDLITGAGTYIGSFGVTNLSFGDIACGRVGTPYDGILYGTPTNNGTGAGSGAGIYSINKLTGAATRIASGSPLAHSNFGGGMDFHPSGSHLYYSAHGDDDVLQYVDPTTGIVSNSGFTLSGVPPNPGGGIVSMSFDLASGYAWAVDNQFATTIWTTTAPIIIISSSGVIQIATAIGSGSGIDPSQWDALCWVGDGPSPPRTITVTPALRHAPKAVFGRQHKGFAFKAA